MRPLLFATAVLIASCFDDTEAAADATDEIVLADPVRAAFYEVAPRKIAASMRRAVDRSCATRLAARGAKAVGTHRWLCGGTKLSFLREVDVLGNRLKIGFVCQHEWASLAYYVDELIAGAIEDGVCVTIWFNSEANAHFLDFGDDDE